MNNRPWVFLEVWRDVVNGQTRDKVWHNFWLTIKDNTNTDILYFAAQESNHCLNLIFSGYMDGVQTAWDDGLGLPDSIKFERAQEWFIQKIKRTLAENNNTLYCIVGRSADYKIPEPHPAVRHLNFYGLDWDDSIFTDVYYWDTYWLTKHICAYASHYEYPIKYSELKIPREKLFACKNGKKHPHRFYFMNQLAKYDLITDNLVTWQGPRYADPDHKFYDPDYQIETGEYWTEQLLTLPERGTGGVIQTDDIITWDSNFSHTEPDGYFKTLLDVVTESSVHEVFFTEKTLKPILTEKPFVCVAGQYHHKILQQMGFELYTDVFDYSFDALPNWQSRCDDIARQLHNLNINLSHNSEIGTRTLREQLWERTRETARHNLMVLCDLLQERRGFPKHIISQALAANSEASAALDADQYSRDAAKIATQIIERIRPNQNKY